MSLILGMAVYCSIVPLQVSRSDLKVTSELADKTEKFVQSEHGGVVKVKVQDELVKSPALSDAQAVEIARLLISLEEELTKPQDFEWAMENGTYILLYIPGADLGILGGGAQPAR